MDAEVMENVPVNKAYDFNYEGIPPLEHARSVLTKCGEIRTKNMEVHNKTAQSFYPVMPLM